MGQHSDLYFCFVWPWVFERRNFQRTVTIPQLHNYRKVRIRQWHQSRLCIFVYSLSMVEIYCWERPLTGASGKSHVALSRERHGTYAHHDDNDWLEVQNKNPRKTLKFSFYGGFLVYKVCSHHRERKRAMTSNKRTLSGCLTTSSKTNASGAWFILIRNTWTYSAMDHWDKF